MLDVKDLEEVQSIIHKEIIAKTEKTKELVPLQRSLGRILAEDIRSNINVPNFKKSKYDGYALKAEDTYDASESSPVALKKVGQTRAGQKKGKIKKGEAVEIATGAPLPKGSNAVIMIEEIEDNGNKIIIKKSAHPGLNTVEKGEDINKGQNVLKKGKKLDYKDTGLISSLGIDEIEVYKKPDVSIISTGDEIVLPNKDLGKGEIYDINGRTITDLLNEMGTRSKFEGISKDQEDDLKEKIKSLIGKDLIILSGGASVGEKDYTVKVLEDLGEVLVHGVAVKPGKPLIIAKISSSTVIGLPGNPTSSLIQVHKIIKPIIEEKLGTKFREKEVKGILQERIKCPKGRKFLLPVKLNNKVIPTFKGSFALTSFTKSEGYVEIPKNIDYVKENKEVQVNLFNP